MNKLETFRQFYRSTITYEVTLSFLETTSEWFDVLGHIGINFYLTVRCILRKEVKIKSIVEQASRIGVDALPLAIAMVGVSGMIIALQLAFEMVKQGAGNYVGGLVSLAIIRELGPIMGSFAVISMVGSSMAAELGTMKVTEQVDAIKVLGVDPVAYLIAPRVIGGFFVMPLLNILACLAGILGGLFASKINSGLSAINYIESVWNALSDRDIYITLLKGSIFGVIISLVCSSIGFMTEGGAKDVGQSTTKAVVWSFVSVVVADYILSLLFFS